MRWKETLPPEREVIEMMWPYGYGMGWGWMAAGWLMMLVFWALVVVGIVALFKMATNLGASSEPRSANTPIEILRRRYAAGELTKEQFEAMKKDVA